MTDRESLNQAPLVIKAASLKYRPAMMRDVARLVGIHEKSFPRFFLTQLGPKFLRALYAGMIESRHGVVIVAEYNRPGDELEKVTGLVGFAAGSPNQATLYRELRNHHLGAFGLAAAIAAVRNPDWTFRLLRAIGRPREAEAMSSPACLMSIAVDSMSRTNGVGGELVRQFESKLAALGCSDYCLTTDQEHNGPVRTFYERLGLSVMRETTTREGRLMLEYYKKIAQGESRAACAES